jgi:hypothetical protein
MLVVCEVVVAVDWLVVFMKDVVLVISVVVELEFVNNVEVVEDVAELLVDGGVVLGIDDVVLVVTSVVGILQSVAVATTPEAGCLVDPGGMTRFWPMTSLSHSTAGLYCFNESKDTPKFLPIWSP